MSKFNFLAEIWPKTSQRACPGMSDFQKFSENLKFFSKIFFAQFSKLSHSEHKKAKKNFFTHAPYYSDPWVLPQKIFQNFLIFFKNIFCSIVSTRNGLN